MPDERDLPAILASDEEREQAVVRLQEAAVAGCLTLQELSDRVGHAQLARTHDDLAALTADLPSREVLPAGTTPVKHLALCSHLVRGGLWELPGRSSWRSWFGTIDLDLRQARLSAADSEMEIHNVFGTVTVIVPAGVQLSVEGGGVFASQMIEPPAAPPAPGAPRLRIRLSGPGGTLHVRAAPPARGLARAIEKLGL